MGTRKFLSPGRLAALAGISGLALAAPGLAQNALDANTQVGSGGINQARPDFAREVRFRNAIVTGNAPGGMSFRGNVGYRAPGEFSGNLGSNELFSFRRDSVNSGLGGMGIRGTDALQYQFAAITGNAPPGGMDPYLTVRRSGSGATSATAAAPGPRGADLSDPARLARAMSRTEDPSSGLITAIRSPAAFMATRDLRPSYVASGYDAQGRPKTVSVSPLRGIAFDDMSMSDLSKRDAATGLPSDTGRPQPAGADQVPEPAHPGQENPVPAVSTTAKPIDARVDQRLDTAQNTRTPYDELVTRMQKSEQARADDEIAARQGGRTGPAGAPSPGDPGAVWEQHLKEVRDSLREQGRGNRPITPGRGPIGPAGTSGAPAPTGATGDTAALPGDPPSDMRPRATTGPTGETSARPGASEALTPDAIRILRSTKEEVKTLAPPGFDAYAQAMKVAQDHLAAERFFDAEERFTSALAARPRDPMAAAGRINAEIGAGMYLSAAVNLRSLLVDHPEMTGVRYAPGLLPRAERLPVVVSRLTELVDAKDEKSRDAALLLAFLGYQTGSQSAVKKGLDTLAQGLDTAKPEEARLVEVLRAVWLEGAAAPAPPPAPAAPATGATGATGAPR